MTPHNTLMVFLEANMEDQVYCGSIQEIAAGINEATEIVDTILDSLQSNGKLKAFRFDEGYVIIKLLPFADGID